MLLSITVIMVDQRPTKLMLVQILKAVEKPGNLYSFVASVFVLSSETI